MVLILLIMIYSLTR